jgi:MFS family permease
MRFTTEGGTTGWVVHQAAAYYSQLAGVLAGVSFTAITLLLGFSSERALRQRDEQRSNDRHAYRVAVALLVMAFLTLFVASFLWAVAAGDTVERRGLLATHAAGIVLSIGSLEIFAALIWLVAHFEPSAPDTTFSLLATVRRGFVLLAGLVGFYVGNGAALIFEVQALGEAWYWIATVGVALLSAAIAGGFLAVGQRKRTLLSLQLALYLGAVCASVEVIWFSVVMSVNPDTTFIGEADKVAHSGWIHLVASIVGLLLFLSVVTALANCLPTTVAAANHGRSAAIHRGKSGRRKR